MNNPEIPSDDVGAKITFLNFCNICEKIKNAKGKQKGDILTKYLNDCRSLNNNSDNHADLHSIIRLLLPQCERERGPYGIKETTFAKMYIRILNLPQQGRDAQKLLNYKAPSSSMATSADFADVAYWVLKSRGRSNNEDISLLDVNKRLDNMASYHNNNQPRAVDDELTKLIASLSALQQKWLIRIILKDLKLGIGMVKILLCFHVDAPDLHDSSNSLSKVCTTLRNPDTRLNEIEIDIFSPYRPMLSERLDITKIKSVMKREDTYFLEMKFDGERFQIHMKDGNFKYFSRNAFEYTSCYGETYDREGMLTKYLKNCLDSSVHSFIIDGEMMGWHKAKKKFSSKGINFDVKKITDNSSYRPCFCAFDILLYNNIILTNKPLFERLEYLDILFKEEEGIIMHSKRVQTQDSDQVLQALNEAIDNQEEGVVLKNIISPYKPNSRKAGWFKIKPEYTDGVMNELDFLIIGGYFVENKRYGEIGSVLLGVADSSKNADGEPNIFHSAGRVKLTLVREEFEELCTKLQPHWNTVSKDTNPKSVCWSKDKPDVWIEPNKSFILQVKASELVKTNAFKTEYTVRFPRVEKIRYDKPWYDCLTLGEFSTLTESSHGVEKLTARNIDHNDIEKSSDISPRKKAKLINIGAQFQPAFVGNVTEKSSLFSGKEFCIITGNKDITKSDLEIKVVENGGQIVQNPGKNTFCIIAGDKNVRMTNAIKSGQHNVANVEWFLKSLNEEYISSGELLKWTPKDLIGMSLEIANEFALKYDKYGDGFTTPATIESLKYSMQKIKETSTTVNLMPVEILHLDKLVFNGASPYSFLRMCNIYFIESQIDYVLNEKMHLSILKIEVELYGGTYCNSIDADTTHIVISSVPDSESIANVKKCIQKNMCKPLMVTLDWISKCIDQKMIVPTEDYELNLIN
ncbi:DNA ligase 4 isoform X1 [Arctopsyche grandis]|uniref:DNA ligase 4 isoform X1 n=1 Tax=Arctopsyche grandis TaxID=121162 RepID=UPI00406D997D